MAQKANDERRLANSAKKDSEKRPKLGGRRNRRAKAAMELKSF